SGFPTTSSLLAQARALLDGTKGFARSAGIFFPLSAAVDARSLPGVAASITTAASAFVMDVDPASSTVGERVPVVVALDAGDFLAGRDLLSLLPLPGRPLAKNRLYAAVLTDGVRGERAEPLTVSDATAQIVAGVQPSGLSDAAFATHRAALAT